MSTSCESVQGQETAAIMLERVHREIRRAANSFLGITELLLESQLTLEHREYIEVLRSATDRLLSVSGRAVRIAHQDVDNTPVCVEFDLRETTEQMASLLTILGAANGMQVISEVAHTGAWPVTGDKKRFEQVVVSVTSALMKSCFPGTILIVVDRTEDEHIRCEITAPTTQNAPADIADFASDLSIEAAEQDVQAAGGTFTFSITAEYTRLNWTMRLLDAWNEFSTATQERELRKPARVLLAEDSPDNQFLIRAYVKDQPYSLESVYDGITAVEKAKRETYALILMDIEMPGMSGIEAMRAIRNWEAETGQCTPIIALTAHSSDAGKDFINEQGFTAYLAKPVRKQAVLAALERYASTGVS